MNIDIEQTPWQRLHKMRPQLRSHAEIQRHHNRGRACFLLTDRMTGQHHMLSVDAHEAVSLMDGVRDLKQIHIALQIQHGEEALTQDELIDLIGLLHSSDLLLSDATPDSREIWDRFQRVDNARRRVNLLYIRLPLYDPDALLERLRPVARRIFGPLGFALWLAVVSLGLLVAIAHWSELTHAITDQIFATQNLFILWLLFPLTKSLHELAHGCATKAFGGEVHETGIALMMFTPTPYVDASASTGMRQKRHRIIVAAAGIASDLLVAALALFLWAWMEPGLLRGVLFNLILIGSISTLVFNANPLMRFDGYYILSDLIEIPNLRKRSVHYLQYLGRRYVLGIAEAAPETTLSERSWLGFYGVGAILYRFMVLGSLVALVAGHFLAAGVVVGIVMLWSYGMVPLIHFAKYLARDPRVEETRARSVGVTVGLAALALVLFVALPVPMHTRTQGIIWLPDEGQVRAGAPGFVRRVLPERNEPVDQDQLLMELNDPELDAKIQLAKTRVAELDARYWAARHANRLVADQVAEDLSAARSELDSLQERAAKLLVRSPSAGRFIPPPGETLLDSFVQQGELVGYVSSPGTPTARVVVSQADVALVRDQTRSVELRLAERIGELIPGRVEREVPGASNRLPSAALTQAGGGPYPANPSDPGGVTTLESVFLFDVSIPAGTQPYRVGGRVYVRFEHDGEALVHRSYRALRRLFLSRFDV